MDMTAPGVDVRPLYQITGEAEFNEVFMNDVRIPDSMRLGERGQGWNVALTTLMNERVALGGGVPERGSGAHRHAWCRRGSSCRDAADSVAMRGRMMSSRQVIAGSGGPIVDRSRGVAAHQLAGSHPVVGRNTPAPEGSVGKAVSAELNQRIYECLMGRHGVGGHAVRRRATRCRGPNESDVASRTGQYRLRCKGFLRSRANTIEGGTSEVMRNILGERVLGLPKEPGVDKNTPWSDIPRN